MASKPKTLEFTLLSAEGLRIRGKMANNNVFAVVRAESMACHATATSSSSSGFHSWNEKFAVELMPHAKHVSIEVKCKTGTGAERDVGVARIAVSDFLGGLVPDHCLQILCYRLRDWDGRENGIVNFSVRVAAGAAAPLPPVAGAPCGFPKRAENDDCSSSSDGVVTGIPVWMNNKSTTWASKV